MKKKLYLEDLSVGDTYISKKFTVTQEEIIEFAQKYDPQVYHLDPELATQTFFGQLVASGWNTASLTMRHYVESCPIGHGLIGAGMELKWPRPVLPGDILYAKSVILAIKPSASKPDRAFVQVKTETINQNNEVVQEMLAKSLVFKHGVLPDLPEIE